MKPCPFCGSKLIGSDCRKGSSKAIWRFRFCETCNAQGPQALTETRAAQLWDKRDDKKK